MDTLPLDARRRARFEALRRQIFAEMGQTSARQRLVWIVPFHALLLAVLIARGESTARALVQGGVLAVSLALFVYQAAVPRLRTLPGFMGGFVTYLVAVANTGGLASPILPMGLMMMVAASIVLERSRAKALFIGMYIGSFGLLALFSRTAAGALVPPLAPSGGGAIVWSSAEYVMLSFASIVFTALSVSRFGMHVAGAYERVAFELATRREEICTESEDRTRALEGIAARLAHEVKNPLAAIKGLSTHMARSSADPKTAERLSIVAAEADRLQSIVDGFLSFSRGLDDLQVAPTKPFELARELSLLLETRASDVGVTLEVTGNADIEINADARKLRQALLNVVLNAMQASPAGQKVTVNVGLACAEQGQTRIQVIDRGAGMSREVLDRIQKPYFTTKDGGSGLGVAVARGLIEQHGGQLLYESAPGRGTTVVIELPPCALTATKATKLPMPKAALDCAFQSLVEGIAASEPSVETSAVASAKVGAR